MKLDEIKALAQKATPGPWLVEPGNFITSQASGIVAEVPCQGANDADVPYIAALSPERVRAMVACIRAADAMANAETTEVLEAARRAFDTAREQL